MAHLRKFADQAMSIGLSAVIREYECCSSRNEDIISISRLLASQPATESPGSNLRFRLPRPYRCNPATLISFHSMHRMLSRQQHSRDNTVTPAHKDPVSRRCPSQCLYLGVHSRCRFHGRKVKLEFWFRDIQLSLKVPLPGCVGSHLCTSHCQGS